MSEPNDDKIQLLVRSVLEAVDARLSGVRAEMLAAANDVQHRHQQLLDTVVSLQQRVEALGRQRAAQDATITELRSEIAALRASAAAPAPAPHVSPAPLVAPLPVTAAPAGEPQLDLSSFTRPLMHDVHVTSQIPIVPMIEPVAPAESGSPLERAAAREAAHITAEHDLLVERDEREAAAWAEASAVSQAADELIDLERLTRLLSDKLEHITLPRPE